MCLARPAWAVDETFSYPDGPLDGQGTVGDWTGPWGPGTQSDPPGGTSPWQIASNQLVTDPIDATDPLFGFEDSDLQRDLTTPIAGSAVYMSYEVTPEDLGNIIDANAFTSGSAGLVVGMADTQADMGTNAPMVTMYDNFDGFGGVLVQFGISLGGVFSASNTAIFDWTPGQTYQVVGRLQFDVLGNQERWTVWINPTSESDTPGGAVTKDLGYDQIGGVRLYEFADKYENVGSSTVDDLRIGDTWASVTSPIGIPGDLNGDGFVGITDLNIVLGNWNQTVPPGDPLADPSGDGFVGIEDLNTVLGNWNAGTPPGGNANIPEPAALVLLTPGAVGVLAMRRRAMRPG
jgi:hypothetical protein